jgi:hypothetical protein
MLQNPSPCYLAPAVLRKYVGEGLLCESLFIFGQYLLPLLELLLSHHLDIILFGKEYILDSRELELAGVSLSNTFDQVWERVTVLRGGLFVRECGCGFTAGFRVIQTAEA